ncbi:V-type proton ATPase subunit E [Exaiptasia diaphana]|uniref:Vacuolar ATP synthase subunit E n=1 Tax=Exaiptasia diaphana TaxID=2652724 RepID=A0A913WTK4_EXADI|nr:V-type proton ATPase subunit E [Exaiptasia diaphana]KXJ20994.1 V-type proton ATPase subunit E [Exaiptasia diaphana]
MALNDAEVKKQIEHMMAFIEQEAKEKAEEIDAKAEEEFNIEKGRLVQQERLKIMNYYERKEKQVELQKKIQRSNLLNQSRLKLLKAQDDQVKGIQEECGEKLGTVTQDPSKYKQVLKGLISQGLFQLLESKVTIRCRQKDLDSVKSVLGDAIEDYKNSTKKSTEVTVDEQNFLSQECSGGVELLAAGGKIKVVNTLESRLDMMMRQMMPEIRELVFGRNKGRHFME